MVHSLESLLSATGFMPHGMCYLWQPGVLTLHIVSDALITIAYFSIPFTLLYFVRKRKDLQFNWMFVCFAVFIVACGLTHLMEIWVVWHPTYWLSGSIKAITALASVPTAILLIKLIPQALRVPSPAALEQQIAERNRAEREVLRVNTELEARVTERTQALETANQALRGEIAERRRVERDLSNSEARIRSVLDSALEAVVLMNSAGTIIEWNAQATAIFGWSRDEALGRNLALTLIPEHRRIPHERELQHYLTTGENEALRRPTETSALRRDGTEFPIELSISPLKLDGTVGFCGFVTDITARKRTEESLRSSQQLLQAVIDNSSAVVYVKDVDGRYMLCNRRFGELFHVSREELTHKTDFDVFPKEHAAAFRAVDERVMAEGKVLQMEEIAPHDDGPHSYISVKSPLFDSAGNIYALCGISTDITPLKESERRQRQQLTQLELLNRITHAIGERQDLPSILHVALRRLEDDLPLDFACACLYNAATATLTVTSIGAKSHALATQIELLEQTQIVVDHNGLSACARGELVHEPDLHEIPFALAQHLLRGGLQTLVAAPLPVESRLFGVLIAARREVRSFTSGECEFLKQLGENIALAAHQAQLYAQLQQAYDDLRQTQRTVMQQERLRALGQMASGIAHDINNAISPISLYTDSLLERENGLSSQARNQIATIQRAIDDVANTVSRMKEFYRLREPQLVLSSVDLKEIVRHSVELTRARWSDEAQKEGIAIDMRLELDDHLPKISGADSDIRDALTNLIFNAVDAMPQGGTLVVSASTVVTALGNEEIRQACLEVADNGVGMDEETRKRCLEPFYTTKGERGTGLGLAMVYGMVERHSAELDISSAPGVGTKIRIVFPASSSTITSATPSPASEPSVPPQRLLVIDDDPAVLESLREILQTEGHRVTAIDNGRGGIDAFIAAKERNEPFDLVITDLGMPHVDGRKVASAIRERSPATPVILLTGWGQRILADNDLPPYVDRVLAKPPKLRELRAALAELIERVTNAP